MKKALGTMITNFELLQLNFILYDQPKKMWEFYQQLKDIDTFKERQSQFNRMLENREKLKKRLDSWNLEEQEEKMKKHHVYYVSFTSNEYPDSLKNIAYPPLILFYKGDETLLKGMCLGVVGSRRPSAYGVKVTKDLTHALSVHFVIVSGLAMGIDTVSHRACLQSKGSTVGVLATGLDQIYPKCNYSLYEAIYRKGCLVSEFHNNQHK